MIKVRNVFRDDKKQVDHKTLNEVLGLTKNILKVLLILMIIVISWVGIVILRELKVANLIVTLLEILSPLFIGIVIAWLFHPFVKWMQKHGVKRIFGVIIAYFLLLGGVAVFMGTLIPILYEQIIDFVGTIPSLFKTIETWLNQILSRFEVIEAFDMESFKEGLFSQLENFGNGLYESLPDMIVNVGSSIISGFSALVIGLVIGFFLLLSFDNVEETFIYLFPKKWRKDADYLFSQVNRTLKNYIRGVVIDAFVVFIVCSLAFSFVGLRAPLLFAVFCAVTNVIPYIGPYIGAVPALIVGFSMNPTIGLLTLIAIVVIQFFEGNFLQEYIMSKTTKLHPVTIIIGLLIFDHLWGIIGMAISVPVIAVLKILFTFIEEKVKFLESLEEVEE